VPTLVVQALSPVLLGSSIFANGIVSSLLVAVIKAIVTGYVALVLAKTYEDVSYGRSF
jgi:fructose-specific phosphotransferase system IIC component